MKIDVSFTASEFDILLEGLDAVKERIGNSHGDPDALAQYYECVHKLELRLRDILKGAVAKALE